jgi:hypothetical protein
MICLFLHPQIPYKNDLFSLDFPSIKSMKIRPPFIKRRSRITSVWNRTQPCNVHVCMTWELSLTTRLLSPRHSTHARHSFLCIFCRALAITSTFLQHVFSIERIEDVRDGSPTSSRMHRWHLEVWKRKNTKLYNPWTAPTQGIGTTLFAPCI